MLSEEIEETTPGKEMIDEDTAPSPLGKVKEYSKELAQVGPVSIKQIEENIKYILALIDEQEAEKIIDNSKKLADKFEDTPKQPVSEAKDGTKKSIKELIGEIFPSLSFYPALGIWGMVDKMISSGKGFDALTPEQARLLPVYISLFFGLVGGKIAYNRLKEYVKTNDSIDSEINETLKAAGIQLDEKRETWDIKYGDEKTGEGKTVREFEKTPLEKAVKFVYDGMQAKYGRQFPEEEDEDDYRSELCDAASKKFNVPCDEIIDKFASDYVDTMPYVTKDENDEYSEIPDDVHELISSIYNENYDLTESVESNLDDAKAFVSNELQAKFGAAIPENDDEKGYVDDLINMATMKYNVPEDSLRNALGLIEEEPIEEPKEPTEEVPGEKIEEV